MARKDNILSRQNPILKTIFCLLLILISSILSFDKFLIIFAFTFIYLILSPTIYLKWLKVIIKIIPFFISLFLFGVIFRISFIDQCILSLRIIYFLLISVYLVETSSTDSFILGNNKQNSNFWFKFEFVITSTIHFIPILINKFNENRKLHSNIINIIVSSLEDSLKEIKQVEETVTSKVNKNCEKREVSLWADLYLSLLVVIPFIFIFIFN